MILAKKNKKQQQKNIVPYHLKIKINLEECIFRGQFQPIFMYSSVERPW